jgi:effector-binding domain-containing protein
MHTSYIPDDIIESYRYAIEKAREDRPRYFEWIKNEIETAITLINQFDKIYVIGGLGSRLIKSSPTFYNQFLATYNGIDKEEIQQEELIQEDDEIEVLLEYVMSIATATPNSNKNAIPTQKDIEAIYQQLSKIKSNINFWELSADNPIGGNEFDHWLRTSIMQDTINVRGDGYQIHIQEIYQEVFQPFNGFLEQYYGFNSEDIYNLILKLDSLVCSKVGNPLGVTQSHKRLTDWMEELGEETIMNTMIETGKHFIRQFTEANPDLFDEEAPDNIISHHLDRVESYSKIFWVIPKSAKDKLIFEKLSIEFGVNGVFFQPPKFKSFPLNDTLINLKPLIKEDGKYFCFSLNLAFRNIFKITEELIKSADAVYYDNSFKGNSNSNSRDNYIELKTKKLFEKLLPTATFYHSLEYSVLTF